MIGALGEVGGAVAVVATLFYLARQIRDSGRQDRRVQYAQLNRDFLQMNSAIAHDESFADVFFRGAMDSSSLSPAELGRFNSGVLMMFRTLDALFHFHREGGIDDWGADSTRAQMVDFISLPGIRQYWTDRRHWFSSEFQEEVDQWLSNRPESTLLGYYGGGEKVEQKSERDAL